MIGDTMNDKCNVIDTMADESLTYLLHACNICVINSV